MQENKSIPFVSVHSVDINSRREFSYLVATLLVAILLQQVGDFLDIDGVVERRSIANLALICRHLALQTLNEMPDCHT